MVAPPSKAPACLKPTLVEGVLVNPADRTTDGMLRPVISVGRGDYANVLFPKLLELLTHPRNRPTVTRLLTFDEAVAGMPYDYYDGLVRQTSSGIYGAYQKDKSKRLWFGSDGPYDLDNERVALLRQHVRELEENIRAERQASYADAPAVQVFIPVLKDELLSKAKVAACRTRQIYVPDLPWITLHKRVMQPLLELAMVNRISNWMTMGVNPYGHEWDALARKFEGRLIFAGDVVECDFNQDISAISPLMHRLAAVCFDARDDRDLFRKFWDRMVDTAIVVDGDVLPVRGKLCSGRLDTTLVNSLTTLVMLMQGVVDVLTRQHGWSVLHAVETFGEGIVAVANGDDFLLGIAPGLVALLPPDDLVAGMERRGHVLSDATKGRDFKYQRLSEVTYLKRQFRYEKLLRRHVAPLDLGTILELTQWTKRGVLREQIERDNINTALLELALHDVDVWDTYAHKIIDAARSVGIEPRCADRQPWLEFSSTYVPKWMRLTTASRTLWTDPVEGQFIGQ
jgi:hypothetical protein